MAATFRRTIEARLDQLQQAQAAVEAFGETQDWAMALAFQINLVIEELGLNIINYGYGGEGPQTIEINVASDADAVTVEIADAAPAFDPLHDAPEPDTDASVDERRVGGLGIYLLREMMDDIRYQRADGRNRLTLVKRRSE